MRTRSFTCWRDCNVYINVLFRNQRSTGIKGHDLHTEQMYAPQAIAIIYLHNAALIMVDMVDLFVHFSGDIESETLCK